MNFDPAQLGQSVVAAAIWGTGFLVVFWISLVIWTMRDIRSRSGSFFIRLLAVLVVLFFFLPGLAIYLILRPRRTLEQEFQMTLEEEALLQSVEEAPSCPGCGRRIKEEWILCPSCHTKLRKVCEHCNRLMELPWNICPYCGYIPEDIQRESSSIENNIEELNIDDVLVNFDIIESNSQEDS